MPFGPRLVGERVVLRPAVAADVEARRRLGRHAEIARSFGARHPASGPMSVDAAAAWFEGLGAAGTVEWIVETADTFLGTARLHSFHEGRARYAIGILDPDRLGQGFGTEATKLVVEYAFASLALERIEVAVLAFNERALRCYRRCGFRDVGRVPNAAVVDGQSYDDIHMAIVRDRVAEA